MGQKRPPGLIKIGKTWHIDKKVHGYGRLCESCRTSNLDEAIDYLNYRLEEIRSQRLYGVRPTRTFREAATRYLEENMHKRSISRDVQALKLLDPYIGDMPLQQVHSGTLRGYCDERLAKVKPGTINRDLAVVRRILNLAARSWRHENGLSRLETAPLIQMLPDDNPRQPYPLSWSEQSRLLAELPKHLADMALFKVNTGTREREVCELRWEWEHQFPELEVSVFVIPATVVKNKQDRLVVLNNVAKKVVESRRGNHATHVFAYQGRPLGRMHSSAWNRARVRAGLPTLRVHDLKHTFGRRLRSAGVGFEDRQDLLGHKSGRITTHYSAAEIMNLIDAANRVTKSRKSPELTVLNLGRERVSA
jgi:integrase